MAQRGQEHEIEGLKSGKKIFLLTLVICVVVPLVGVVVALWLSNDLKGVSEEGASKFPPLVWSEHNTWQTMAVNPTEIVKRPGHKPPFEGRVRRNLPFELDASKQQEIAFLRSSAEQWQQNIDASMDALADFSDESFYGHYLRASRDSDSDAKAAAFEHAPKALAIQYLDEMGKPITMQDVGTISVICAKKKDGIVDEGVVLVYPHERTDKNGYIYLPVYDTVLRLEGKLPNVTSQAGILQGVVEYDIGGGEWFEIPGQVGELKATVKRRNQN